MTSQSVTAFSQTGSLYRFHVSRVFMQFFYGYIRKPVGLNNYVQLTDPQKKIPFESEELVH